MLFNSYGKAQTHSLSLSLSRIKYFMQARGERMQIRHIIPHIMISSIFIESIYFSDLKPPASTKTAVYQWDKTIQNLTKEIGKSGLHYLI